MNCPKCGKILSNKIETVNEDGGLTVIINCSKCESKFSTFINEFDLEPTYFDEKISI